ncbi:hypothetical protein CG723_09055 [Streptomyces sp. CB01635]|nr:hypothetical protein CG723_09055 [Streptomyces sp. CB01635]
MSERWARRGPVTSARGAGSRGWAALGRTLAGRTGQEDQLGALGLVLNTAVLWTTPYLDAAVEELRALPAEEHEHDVLDEDEHCR